MMLYLGEKDEIKSAYGRHALIPMSNSHLNYNAEGLPEVMPRLGNKYLLCAGFESLEAEEIFICLDFKTMLEVCMEARDSSEVKRIRWYFGKKALNGEEEVKVANKKIQTFDD